MSVLIPNDGVTRATGLEIKVRLSEPLTYPGATVHVFRGSVDIGAATLVSAYSNDPYYSIIDTIAATAATYNYTAKINYGPSQSSPTSPYLVNVIVTDPTYEIRWLGINDTLLTQQTMVANRYVTDVIYFDPSYLGIIPTDNRFIKFEPNSALINAGIDDSEYSGGRYFVIAQFLNNGGASGVLTWGVETPVLRGNLQPPSITIGSNGSFSVSPLDSPPADSMLLGEVLSDDRYKMRLGNRATMFYQYLRMSLDPVKLTAYIDGIAAANVYFYIPPVLVLPS